MRLAERDVGGDPNHPHTNGAGPQAVQPAARSRANAIDAHPGESMYRPDSSRGSYRYVKDIVRI